MLKFRLNLLTSACQGALSDKDLLNLSTKANTHTITNIIKCQWILSKMWYNIFLNSVTDVKTDIYQQCYNNF